MLKKILMTAALVGLVKFKLSKVKYTMHEIIIWFGKKLIEFGLSNNKKLLLEKGRTEIQLKKEELVELEEAKVYAEYNAERLREKLGLSLETNERSQIIGELATLNLQIEQLKKQQNIMYSLVEGAKEFTSEDLNSEDLTMPEDDWLQDWQEKASRFSNQHAYTLWGKILAGEIKNKGTFSYKTLDILKNLTQKDAELFLKAVSISFGYAGFIFTINSISESNKLSYFEWVTLQDIGLVTQVSRVLPEISLEISFSKPVEIELKDYIFILGTNNKPFKFSEGCYLFTEAGQSLLKIIDFEENLAYLKSIKKYIEEEYSSAKITILNKKDKTTII